MFGNVRAFDQFCQMFTVSSTVSSKITGPRGTEMEVLKVSQGPSSRGRLRPSCHFTSSNSSAVALLTNYALTTFVSTTLLPSRARQAGQAGRAVPADFTPCCHWLLGATGMGGPDGLAQIIKYTPPVPKGSQNGSRDRTLRHTTWHSCYIIITWHSCYIIITLLVVK